MGHKDPALTYLKDYGYAVVRLPRADIDPLLLVQRDGKELSRLGPIDTLFIKADVPIPKISRDVAAADIKGSIKTTLSLGLGLSLLGNFLKAFGASGAGLDLAYRRARTVTFEFTNLRSDSINLTQLDQFLGTAREDLNSRHLSDLLEADAVYCVTTTLKTQSFTVDATGDGGATVKVEAPSIQEMVGADVTVEAERKSTSKVKYEGKKQLVFGFQAVRLFFAQGKYSAFEQVHAGDVVMRGVKRGKKKSGRTTARKTRHHLIPEGAFVSLD